MPARVYLQRGKERFSVPSLTPFLADSLGRNTRMDAAVMRPEERAHCRWIGYGLGKGISHPEADVSVFATPDVIESGLHAKLAQGFPNVDPCPQCYDVSKHVGGFGGFVRWAYFADPARVRDVFGVDWAITLPASLGVANSMIAFAEVIKIAARHGVPQDAEAVLLNWRMCEDPYSEEFRRREGLITVADWLAKAAPLFGPSGPLCPRCGLRTLEGNPRFCYRCGCQPAIVRQRRCTHER